MADVAAVANAAADAADAAGDAASKGKEKSKGWGRINPFARKKEADDAEAKAKAEEAKKNCLLYTSPSPRDRG